MNKTSIKTYDDLVVERERLQALLIVQRQRVVTGWEGVKTELEPVNNAFGVLGKFTHSDNSSPLLNMGLKFASDILLKNFVLARAGWVARLAVPFVMKNYSSHLLMENGRGLLGKLKGLGNIFKSKKTTPHESGKKIVNTEEQNRAVNPGQDNTTEEASPEETPIAGTAGDQSGEREKPSTEKHPEGNSSGFLFYRNVHNESRAVIDHSPSQDHTIMVGHYSLRNGKADPFPR